MKISIILLALFGLSFTFNDSGNSCGESVNQSIKKAAKAGAQGVIIHLESSRWEAIKYK
jgi:hypothetical protein